MKKYSHENNYKNIQTNKKNKTSDQKSKFDDDFVN